MTVVWSRGKTNHESMGLCQRRGKPRASCTDLLTIRKGSTRPLFIVQHDELQGASATQAVSRDVVGVSAATGFNTTRQRPNCGRHDKTASKVHTHKQKDGDRLVSPNTCKLFLCLLLHHPSSSSSNISSDISIYLLLFVASEPFLRYSDQYCLMVCPYIQSRPPRRGCSFIAARFP